MTLSVHPGTRSEGFDQVWDRYIRRHSSKEEKNPGMTAAMLTNAENVHGKDQTTTELCKRNRRPVSTETALALSGTKCRLSVCLLVCATLLPSAACSRNQPNTACISRYALPSGAGKFVEGSPRLRKSVSYSSEMNTAVVDSNRRYAADSMEDRNINSQVYTPVHSSSDLSRAGDLRSQRMRAASTTSTFSSGSSEEACSERPYVYTRLQTQLFPEMRF